MRPTSSPGSMTMASRASSSPRMVQLQASGPTGKVSRIMGSIVGPEAEANSPPEGNAKGRPGGPAFQKAGEPIWRDRGTCLTLLARLGGRGDWGGLGALQHRVRAGGGALVEDGQTDGSAHEDDRRPGGEPGEDVGRGAGAESGLRTLAAEGACQVGRAALLQEDNADEKEAHKHVQDNHKVEKDLHFLSCFPSQSG